MKGIYYDAMGNLIGIEISNEDKIRSIADHYGHKQINKAVEELIELAEVLVKDYNKGSVDIDSLYEEIADVEIMLAQVKLLYDIDQEELREMINRKLNRTIRRMAE